MNPGEERDSVFGLGQGESEMPVRLLSGIVLKIIGYPSLKSQVDTRAGNKKVVGLTGLEWPPTLQNR